MSTDEIVWRSPSPLWSRERTGGTFRRPTLLRFAGDDFMEQFGAAIGVPGGLDGLVAASETWRDPGAGLDRPVTPGPITLFQPTHGRFYLVTCSLVCQRYGHPDRAVDSAAAEQTSFLLRRLVPASADTPVDPDDPTTYNEYGWVDDAWQLAVGDAAAEGEQRLPLFAATSAVGGRRRRVLAGLIPASGREAREQAPPIDPDTPGDPLAALADPRLHGLEPVIVGLQTVLRDGGALRDGTALPEGSVVEDDQIRLVRESLFFTLVDLAAWLDAQLPGALTGQVPLLEPDPDDPDDPDGPDDLLAEEFHAGRTWRQAIVAARDAELTAVFDEGAAEPEPVADMTLDDMIDAIGGPRVAVDVPPTETDLLGGLRVAVDVPPTETDLFVAAAAALPAAPGATPDAPPAGDADADAARAAAAVYVVRCLYERPRCLPSQRQRVSAPSRTFRMAAFHEPDAPARPVRIALPVDASPGGLRRFPRNVSMVLSNELRRQMDRVSLDTLRDGTVGSPGSISLGMICSLSIPIITICALILLMIIVGLLNIVFFWLPLFKVCLPIPGQDRP